MNAKRCLPKIARIARCRNHATEAARDGKVILPDGRDSRNQSLRAGIFFLKDALPFSSVKMTSFKFFKHKGGISAFAAITLESVEGATQAIEWDPAVQFFKPIYGEAVLLGIGDALAWHAPEGETWVAFHILEFTELPVDTKPDAVRCAATMAAWKALGHCESGITFEYDHEWKARLVG